MRGSYRTPHGSVVSSSPVGRLFGARAARAGLSIIWIPSLLGAPTPYPLEICELSELKRGKVDSLDGGTSNSCRAIFREGKERRENSLYGFGWNGIIEGSQRLNRWSGDRNTTPRELPPRTIELDTLGIEQKTGTKTVWSCLEARTGNRGRTLGG